MGVSESRYRTVLMAALVVTAGFGGAACGSDPEPEPSFVGAAEVCQGVFPDRMEKTVEAVTGATSFERRAGGGMARVIEKIKEGYASDRTWSTSEKLCQISAKGVSSRERTSLSFSIYAPQDVGDPRNPDGVRLFPLGKEAVAGARSAGLYFECVSPRLEGSERVPARIRGGLGKAHDRGDAVSDLVANLTVLHAGSLAVAKELECEGNGGLPENLDPELKPLS